MSEAKRKRLEKIPNYLIPGCGKFGAPGMIKRHAAYLCAAIDDQWRLYAEGCLRNRFFREQILKRGDKCMACSKTLEAGAKIEQHHNDYLWTCIGHLLPDSSEDIHRETFNDDEWPTVPDCRRCSFDNPDHFKECVRRVYPVHDVCHGRIHDKERFMRQDAAEQLLAEFKRQARPVRGSLQERAKSS